MQNVTYTLLAQSKSNTIFKFYNCFKCYGHERFGVDKTLDIAKGWSLYGEGLLSKGLGGLKNINLVEWIQKAACYCPISDDPGDPCSETVLVKQDSIIQH